MVKQNFNPIIEAVMSIRHLVIASSEKWTAMRINGAIVQKNLGKASSLIEKYTSVNAKEEWKYEMNNYTENLKQLKMIMNSAISKINNKKSNSLVEDWNNYPQYSDGIKSNLTNLKNIGKAVLPENKIQDWNFIWTEISVCNKKIQNEAEASRIQLKMIEEYSPEEVDDLVNSILKHIPSKFTIDEANKYTDEYMKAFEDIKKEACQKKNIWDKFLDILAGGSQQTPAQRVMMQRWVDGEKGELH